MKAVLPPVTKSELDSEVDLVMARIGLSARQGEDISVFDYVNAVVDNSYWKDAGSFVVLIPLNDRPLLDHVHMENTL